MENRLRFLVVEDHADTREFMEILLTDAGHDVALAANGQEALEVAASGRPFDVILLDMQMPVLDGLETARRLRSMPATADTPILAISAKASGVSERLALEAGCDAYLLKPCPEEAILAAIQLAITRRRGAAHAEGEHGEAS